MCYLLETEKQKPKVAKKDIRVIKISTQRLTKRFITSYRGFIYVLGERIKVKMTVPVYDSMFCDDFSYTEKLKETNPNRLGVSRGFHSFKSITRAKQSKYGQNIRYGVFIIPKGSKYYYNKYNKEYVSDQIYFKEYYRSHKKKGS